MARELRLVVVTPEKTVLDQVVTSLRFPLYDGMIGVLPGRIPLVGRLGYGELNIKSGSSHARYFIDGGFVQIKEDTISLLTNQAIPAADISISKAEEALAQSASMPTRSDAEIEAKSRDLLRARRMLGVARSRS